jgi:hypothetical protein
LEDSSHEKGHVMHMPPESMPSLGHNQNVIVFNSIHRSDGIFNTDEELDNITYSFRPKKNVILEILEQMIKLVK